jgi:hypothetical protein
VKASDVLRMAAELLVTKGWTRGEFARDMWGNGTFSRSPSATTFCAIGACRRVADYEDASPAISLGEVVAAGHGYPSVAAYNDSHGKAESVQLLDAAYVLALQEEGIEPEDVL